MCLTEGPQYSDAGEARTHDPSVSSQDNLFTNVLTYITVTIVFERFLKSLFIQIWRLLTVMFLKRWFWLILCFTMAITREKEEKTEEKEQQTILDDYLGLY